MKRKWLKALSVLACLTLSAGLAACGMFGGDNDKDSSSSTAVSSSSNWWDSSSEDEILFPTEGITYKKSVDGTYAIATGYDPFVSDYAKRAVIASTYEGVPVKSIANSAFSGINNLMEVVIPEGVTNIGNNAFLHCGYLTKITLPNSLEIAGINPFGSNDNLQYTIKDGLKYLGNKENPYIYLQEPENAGITSATIAEGCKVIGAHAFSKSKGLTNVIIPDSVATIGEYAFQNCTNLGYTVKDGLKYLGNTHNPYIYLAGAESVDITTAKIESTCKAIGDYAFEDCKSLTRVIIPDSVRSIGYSAFYYCQALQTVSISKNCALWCIGAYAFYNCDSLRSIVIPDTVIKIGSKTFESCESLTSIVIPVSVMEINKYAFAFSDNLKIYCEAETTPKGWDLSWNHSERPVVWGYGIENSEENSSSNSNTSESEEEGTEGLQYTNSYGLSYSVTGYTGTETEVIIPSVYNDLPVKSISGSAFSGCSNLTKIVIPESVTSIGGFAFENCTSLMEIVIPKSVTSVGNGLFTHCYSLTIYCEVKSKPSTWQSRWNGGMSSFECPVVWDCRNNDAAENGFVYKVVDGLRYVLFTPKEYDNVATVARQASNITTANILATVTYNGVAYSVKSTNDEAFKNCARLTEVIIPNSLTSIGEDAFSGCSILTKIVIPNSVTYIAKSAFYDCANLTIYCETESKPSNWKEGWNSSYCPVIWGYKGE